MICQVHNSHNNLFEINHFPLQCRECRVITGVETRGKFTRHHLGSVLREEDAAKSEEIANSIGLE
jgi:hypothetical protein